MKVALIPPISHLAQFARTRYHLVLAHLCIESPQYLMFYEQRVKDGDYVMLDNSAHELGVGMDADALLRVIRDLNPSEVILPDRLFWGQDTVKLSREFQRVLLDNELWPRRMGVPQGRTIDEWYYCMRDLVELGVQTIGISKDYEVWPGGLELLAALVPPTVDIHLLGLGRDLSQLPKLAERSNIRGVDSAKPFVYALSNTFMTMDVQYPGRHHTYFNAQFTSKQRDIADVNVARFLELSLGVGGDV